MIDLRKALMDYYGTAMQSYPMAALKLAEEERAGEQQLVELAKEAGLLK